MLGYYVPCYIIYYYVKYHPSLGAITAHKRLNGNRHGRDRSATRRLDRFAVLGRESEMEVRIRRRPRPFPPPTSRTTASEDATREAPPESTPASTMHSQVEPPQRPQRQRQQEAAFDCSKSIPHRAAVASRHHLMFAALFSGGSLSSSREKKVQFVTPNRLIVCNKGCHFLAGKYFPFSVKA